MILPRPDQASPLNWCKPFERIGFYRGLYHVLGGTLSAINGVGTENLSIKKLINRVEKGNINLRLPTSSDRDRTVTYSNLDVDLEPDARQINFDIIFNKSITESSNLSANITHVQNGDHSNSSDDQNFISFYYKKTF